jgi:hypothetical protein
LALQTGGTTALTISSAQAISFTNTISTPNTFGFKNRIINGGMVIDQRNAGASVTPSANGYILDRGQYEASQASKFTIQQNKGSVTPPVGFSNYFGMSVASAVTIGAGDYFDIVQLVEGFNFADCGFGTANAKTVTLSFQVYSSLTGTFGGSIANNTFNRSYPFTYTISSANTWTTISVTIAGDTSGTWVGATNGIGLRVYLGIGVGSTYSGTANAWASTGYVSATGATSVVATSGATFYITGVQLEVGTQATSFDFRDYGRELILCYRYYYQTSPIGTSGGASNAIIMMGGIEGAASAALGCPLPVTMRSVPSLTINDSRMYSFSSNMAPASWSITTNRSTKTNGGVETATTTTVGGQACYIYGQGVVSYAAFSAEL